MSIAKQSYKGFESKVSSKKLLLLGTRNRKRIIDWGDLLRGYWQSVFDNRPGLFDPPRLTHVGQHGTWLEGNCYSHHTEMDEVPCTSWNQCNRNEDARAEETKLNNRNLHRNVRRRKGYQPTQQQEQEQPESSNNGKKESPYDSYESFAEEFFR